MDNQPPQNPTDKQTNTTNQPASSSPPAANAPLANAGDIFSNSSVILGYNETQKAKTARHWNFVVIGSAFAGVAVAIGLVVYMLIYPIIASSTYKSSIKTAYDAQSSEMSKVFATLQNSFFSDTNNNEASVEQSIKQTTNTISTAAQLTDNLQTKNSFTALPGTTWLGQVSSANNEDQAVQTYITNSQTFLNNYRELVIYVEQIHTIMDSELPKISQDFQAISAAGSNLSLLLLANQQAVTDLSSFASQAKSLRPSPDLAQYNQDLTNYLDGMSNGTKIATQALQNATSEDFYSALAEAQSSFSSFVGLLSSNPLANIQTKSLLHSELQFLESEHPVQ